jgi:hypothetical protein
MRRIVFAVLPADEIQACMTAVKALAQVKFAAGRASD